MGSYSFGSSASSGSKIRAIPPLPVLNCKAARNSSAGGSLPVWRSGVDKYFTVNPTAVQLFNGEAETSVAAAVNSTTILAASNIHYAYLDSTDQCVYLLSKVIGSGQLQLWKVSDSLGTSTTIGSPFTPANPSNWGRSITPLHLSYCERSGGNLKVYGGNTSSVYHLVSLTTGAVISEDVSYTVAGYKNRHYLPSIGGYSEGFTYLSADGLYGSSTLFSYNRYISGTASTQVQVQGLEVPAVVSSQSGLVSSKVIDPYTPFLSGNSQDGGSTVQSGGSDVGFSIIAIDSDKLAFMSSSSDPIAIKYFYKQDFDLFIKSLANYYAGF